MDDSAIKRTIRRRTIFSFVVFVLMLFTAYASWKYLWKQPGDNGALRPLRKVMNANETVFRKVAYSNKNLAPEYPKEKAVKKVRVNGSLGMKNDADTTGWKLTVIRKPGDTLTFTLADIKALPKKEIIFDFKCIEGWDQVTHWGGVEYSEFAKKYGLPVDSQYSGLETPDKGYYVGIDMPSMLQPQTLLCYEMNGKPLPINQGYPLRLIIPVKYGIKSLKRIGTIFFSNSRPRDYWAERGYDYYSGL